MINQTKIGEFEKGMDMVDKTELEESEKKKRPTYPQDWPCYNNAQTKEKQMFYSIINEIVDYIPLKERMKGRGRPALNERDMLFCSIIKIYSMFSSRRIISDLNFAKKMGYIQSVPHFNSVCNYINSTDFEYYLKYLIQLSSLPLRQIEDKFAVDASGFGIAKYEKWVKARLNNGIHKVYKKLHVSCGVYTNIITDAEVTDGTKNDSPFFQPLVNSTAKRFNIKEVSADKGYLSRDNLQVVSSVGGIAFIPFKKNVTGKARGSMLWSRMFEHFSKHKEDFMKHYHLRSNVETVFSMIKMKFGGNLKTKKDQSQKNEVLLKCLCHNICVLISETFTLGIDLDFNKCAEIMSAQK